jgi:hypothetical protein
VVVPPHPEAVKRIIPLGGFRWGAFARWTALGTVRMDLRIAEQWPDGCFLLALASGTRGTAMIASVKTGKRSDERWTPEEDQRLLVLIDAEASWPLIAITLERGVEDVQERAGKLRHEIELGLKAKK